MALSNDLLLQFAKIATAPTETTSKNETIVYGTVVEHAGTKYVRIDGSELLTPAAMTVDAEPDERVTVLLKNHSATVTGNITSPAVRKETVTIVINNVTEVQNILAGKVDTEDLDAATARIAVLEANDVTITGTLNAHDADIVDLEADNVDIKGRLDAVEATIGTLEVDELTVEALHATFATVEDLNATNAEVDTLQSDVADIDTLIFGSAAGTTIQTSFANAVVAQLGNAQIKSAMIDSVSASKITAGDIVTNNVRVLSEDGKLLISDETIQISDGTRVRVQIGKDAANDYSINVWDINGNLMFSKGGITDAAIKDAIIRNDMVSDTANIHASKLDIDSLFEEINGSANTIKSTKVYLDDKNQTLDVAFKSLETSVADQGETITSQGTAISTIQGQISSKVWQQDINKAADEMATQYSALEQNLDGFQATVGNLETRVGTAESNLDQLEIGGRNMLLNTIGHDPVAQKGATARISGAKVPTNADGILTLDCSTTNAELYYRFAVPTAGNLWGFEPGKSYVLSGKAKVSTETGVLDRFVVRTQYHTLNTGWTGGIAKTILSADTDDWVYFTAPFTVEENATGYYASLQLYFTDSWAGIIQLTELKLEQGTRATAWSPAPEDMLSNTSAEIKYATKSELSVESNRISANVTETTNLGTRVSAVEQTAEGLTVKLGGIRVGGRNIIANTSMNEIELGAFPASGYSEGVTGKTTIVPDKDEYVLSFDAKSTVDGDMIQCFFYSPNTTQSVVTSTGHTSTSADGAARVILTDSWQRYWIKYTQKGSETTVTKSWIVGRRSPGVGTGVVSVRGIKMEEGNQPTAWSPAPEDVDSGILAASKTATDYLNLSSAGLVVGQNPSNPTAGNTLISADGVSIRKGATNLAEFKAASRSASGITSATITSTDSADSESDGITSVKGTIVSNESRANVYITTNGNPVYFSNGLETDKVLINNKSGIISNANILLNGSLVDNTGEGILTPINSYGNMIIGYGRYEDGGATHVYGTRVKTKTKSGFSASVNGVAAIDTNNASGNATFGWHLYEANSGETNIYGKITSLFAKDDIRLSATGNSIRFEGDLVPYVGNTYNLGTPSLSLHNIYISCNDDNTEHGIRFSNASGSANAIGVNPEGYRIFGNTEYCTNIVSKSTTTTNTGYSFKITCGDNPALTVEDNDARLLAYGGTDSTGRYLGSMAVYKRTYSSNSANVYVTTNGMIGRAGSSSERYKKDIVDLPLETVKGLYDMPVRQFKYRTDYIMEEDERYEVDMPGFIAEEVAEYLPIACDHITNSNGDVVPEMWNSKIIIPSLLKLIQDLNTRVKVLEAGGE